MPRYPSSIGFRSCLPYPKQSKILLQHSIYDYFMTFWVLVGEPLSPRLLKRYPEGRAIHYSFWRMNTLFLVDFSLVPSSPGTSDVMDEAPFASPEGPAGCASVSEREWGRF